jgi:drug/metabolite transporter (DMT)-like permease
MKFILPILFALIAAIGNALFAFGQKQSANVSNGLLYVGASAFVACLLALIASPLVGSVSSESLRQNWMLISVSGLGLFLTYLGFNLLYSKFGVTPYVLYAVISILTTTVVVGVLLLKEHINGYHKVAIISAFVTVFLFSIGQTKL